MESPSGPLGTYCEIAARIDSKDGNAWVSPVNDDAIVVAKQEQSSKSGARSRLGEGLFRDEDMLWGSVLNYHIATLA